MSFTGGQYHLAPAITQPDPATPDDIDRLSQRLDMPERQQIELTLRNSRQLLAELDRSLYNMFIAREKVNEITARINWLHDDFTSEMNSLVQDFSWQQGALLDQMEDKQGHAVHRLQANLRAVQGNNSRSTPWRALRARLSATCATDSPRCSPARRATVTWKDIFAT